MGDTLGLVAMWDLTLKRSIEGLDSANWASQGC